MKHTLFALLFLWQGSYAWAQNKALFTVHANKPTATVAPTMWGLFFEDINLGAVL